jgi:anti-sigma factor (TIGR02949 family)
MQSQAKKSKFDCADIEHRVHAYIDDRLNAQERALFEEHLDYCLPCDKKMEFEKKLKLFVKMKASEKTYPTSLDQELKNILKNKDNYSD